MFNRILLLLRPAAKNNYSALHPHKLGLAFASAIATGYAVCSLLFVFAPQFCIKGYAYILHLKDFEKYAADITVTTESFIFGVIQVFIATYLIKYLVACVYNRLLES